ncbi:MAG: hypothetical protein QF464_06075 [Myxococcota bacterium]|nr:hypothetical protein [Myxococcota bacterium]
MLRSNQDSYTEGTVRVTVPNGATGYYEDVGFGGRPVENRLANDQGEYDSQITMNAGSYYDKMYTSMLFTESVDNYISSSRDDFVDARYRSVSLADLFPDGYRRMLGNALTGDDFIKGPRVPANNAGNPLLDDDGYPAWPIGWTTWWGAEPETCFPANGTRVCKSYGGGAGPDEDDLDALGANTVAVLDPQIGWEQQKFLIAWTMLYLPENQQQGWIDSLRVWELGVDNDPGFANRIEFHNPTGKIYVAKTSGTETIFGRTVQKGIAARVLEYANELLAQAYETTAGPDLDGDGQADWRIPVVDPDTGTVHVLYDDTIDGVDDEGYLYPDGRPGCDASENEDCTCGTNRACIALEQYVEVPFFLRQSLATYGLAQPSPQGIY